ncbi:DNA helicase [Bacillus sp. M6-12]|uniref:RNA polymerase recycling motor HelD n=1 Tax=Bacillus sp. M6-12 TaxID=2054166 RepID=UPI000C7722E0|nr:RNA polymerase recycling motor HelD [Bacillus sp. M6-12]PLS17132.1 DNA helicase [Bacillus sp. M6-12]
MPAEQHPQFLNELHRLDFTKRYMDVVIKTAQSSKDQFRKNMLEAFGNEDWLESGGYSEILTNASFFEMSKAELESLERAKGKPYFARVDFERPGAINPDVLYFGKTSLYQRENQEQIIVDWRSPIANLYYEGRLGEIEYTAEGESFKGDITLKRQLMIEDGALQDIRDIDMTTTDELLQESLAKSSSSRLTDIISTIQEEQNQIIRADLNKPIIVQGAAGSGKTTIALHRISYFLYHYREVFDPRELMILAPSRLFIDYISEALPELEVDRVKQFTYPEYVQMAIGKKLKLTEDNKLVAIVEGKNSSASQEAAWISGIKGSELFKKILDNYLMDIFLRFKPKNDFFVDKYRLYSSRKFFKLFLEEYWYLPLYKRVEKLKNILQSQVRAKKKMMVEKVINHYDTKIERALFKDVNPELRRAYVTKGMDKKEERLKEIKKAISSSVNDYFKQFERKGILEYYSELFDDANKLAAYSEGGLTKEDAEKLTAYTKQMFTKKMFELEDLAPLLYLFSRLFGVDKERRAKNIVIDEAQDYSFLQIQALKTANDTDMFTLVGDLAQGIHSYRGIESWDEIRQLIFPRSVYKELQKSYRTTVEIMNEANKLLKLLPYQFPQVEPVVRHGEKPEFIKITDDLWLEEVAAVIGRLRSQGLKTFAIICKTMADCELAHRTLVEAGEQVYLLKEHASIPKESVVILPSYLSKGLEFDAVLALSLSETYSDSNELDVKLLYVTMTRPLHRLYFFGKNKSDFLLDNTY